MFEHDNHLVLSSFAGLETMQTNPTDFEANVIIFFEATKPIWIKCQLENTILDHDRPFSLYNLTSLTRRKVFDCERDCFVLLNKVILSSYFHCFTVEISDLASYLLAVIYHFLE